MNTPPPTSHTHTQTKTYMYMYQLDYYFKFQELSVEGFYQKLLYIWSLPSKSWYTGILIHIILSKATLLLPCNYSNTCLHIGYIFPLERCRETYNSLTLLWFSNLLFCLHCLTYSGSFFVWILHYRNNFFFHFPPLNDLSTLKVCSVSYFSFHFKRKHAHHGLKASLENWKVHIL